MTLTNPPPGTKYLELTFDKVSFLWKRLGEISGLFDDYTRNDQAAFRQWLMAPDSIWLERLDGNGVLYLTQVRPHLSAVAHFVYWDKKLSGREEFTMDCLRWAMSNADLKKINSYIPHFAGAALHFARKLGFKKEGYIRRWSYSRGKLFDAIVYGMTYEEAFDGRVHESADEHGRAAEPDDGLHDELLQEPASTNDSGEGSASNGGGDSGHSGISSASGS